MNKLYVIVLFLVTGIQHIIGCSFLKMPVLQLQEQQITLEQLQNLNVVGCYLF